MWLLYFVCYLFFFRYDSMDQFSTHSCVSRNHRQPSETSVPYYTYSPATDKLFWRHVKKRMCLGTFSRLARSLATVYIFARVRIFGTSVPFFVTGNFSEFPVTKKWQNTRFSCILPSLPYLFYQILSQIRFPISVVPTCFLPASMISTVR